MTEEAEQGCHICLVGTKLDLIQAQASLRAVRQDEVSALATKHSAHVFETSAKAGQGVSDIFERVVEQFHSRVHDDARGGRGGGGRTASVGDGGMRVRVAASPLPPHVAPSCHALVSVRTRPRRRLSPTTARGAGALPWAAARHKSRAAAARPPSPRHAGAAAPTLVRPTLPTYVDRRPAGWSGWRESEMPSRLFESPRTSAATGEGARGRGGRGVGEAEPPCSGKEVGAMVGTSTSERPREP